MGRSDLKSGMKIRTADGSEYEILSLIGEGGGGIIYSAKRKNPGAVQTALLYALKECYPLGADCSCTRDAKGEIIPDSSASALYLEDAKERQKNEARIGSKIYRTGFRLTPILDTYDEAELSLDGTSFSVVHNTISIMESLSEKGESLRFALRQKPYLTLREALPVIEQLLYAVDEVHAAGYLHLDLQDGNIFVKGNLAREGSMISLIDFGCARALEADGRTAVITDRILYGTKGFTAPEIVLRGTKDLQLGKEADLFSVGALLLLLLTGKKSHTLDLIHPRGSYLPRFILRKIQCPPHLASFVNRILCKALAEHPEDRYHSCGEMLEDIRSLQSQIAPYADPLDAEDYEAFICYRHSEIDTRAALALRNAIERYRFEGKHPGKVFLDTGELSSGPDFGRRIRNALQHSRRLIVICSEQTRQSRWVNDEIRTFLEYHDAEHILLIQTGGKTDDILPDALTEIGFSKENAYFADASGETPGKVVRKIRRDTKYRILAPIFHTTYDSLKQRKKLYRMQQAAVLAAIGLILMSGFLAYSRSQNIALKAEHHQTLLQESARLQSEARKQLEVEHNPLEAISLAIEGYELAPADPEISGDFYSILAESMNLYRTPVSTLHGVYPEAIMNLSEITENLSGTTALSETTAAPSEITASLYSARFVPGTTKLLLVSEGEGILCYDYSLKKEEWFYKNSDVNYKTAVRPAETSVLVDTESDLLILDSASGTLQSKINKDSLPGGTASEEKQRHDGEYYLSGRALYRIEDTSNSHNAVYYSGRNRHYISSRSSYRLTAFIRDDSSEASFSEAWSRDITTTTLSDAVHLCTSPDGSELSLSIGHKLVFLDTRTGAVISEFETERDIIASLYETGTEEAAFRAVLASGDIVSPKEDHLEGITLFPDNIDDCVSTDDFYLVRKDDQVLVYSKRSGDPGYKTAADSSQNSPDIQDVLPSDLKTFGEEETCTVSGTGAVLAAAESGITLAKDNIILDTLELDSYSPILSDCHLLDLSDGMYLAGRALSDAVLFCVRDNRICKIADIENVIGYDEAKKLLYIYSVSYDVLQLDSQVTPETEEIGTIPRYTPEEIIDLAREKFSAKETIK